MKKVFLLVCLLACGFFAVVTAASATARPVSTSPEVIAMTFLKLTGQRPDFEALARRDPAYLAASEISRQATLEKLIRARQEAFRLQTQQESITIETRAKVSPYSRQHLGFFVENFKADTFFSVEHEGRFYAVIPRGIMDRQWLKVPDPAVALAIERTAAASKTGVKAALFLTPKYADGKAPVRLNGKDHWLIAADVVNMMLYGDDDAFLWQSEGPAIKKEEYNKLLNLYEQR